MLKRQMILTLPYQAIIPPLMQILIGGIFRR